MPTPRAAVLIALILVIAFSTSAQPPANPAPPAVPPPFPSGQASPSIPTIQVTSRLVVLDVVVVDANGNPVKGLKQSDFTLTEDGVPQSLASFHEHNTSTPASETLQSELPPNTFAVQRSMTEDQTRTVIVLDNLPIGDAPSVRTDIQTFMKTVAPGNPIAIYRIDWQGMHMVQGFTTDHKVLQEAAVSKRILPPLGFPVRYALPAGSPTRKLARYISAIPGRVNLIWLTSAADAPDGQSEFPNLSSVASNLDGSTHVLRLSRVALYPVSVEGAVGRDISLSAIMNRILANSHMQELATAAGGHAYFNGIPQALTQIVAAGDDYYTLSYVPTNPDWNGAYRNVHIDAAGYPQPTPPESIKGFWSKFLGWTEDNPSKLIYRSGYFARTKQTPAEELVHVLQGSSRPPDPNRRLLSYSPKGDPAGYSAETATAIQRAMQLAMQLGSLPLDRIDFTLTATASADTVKLKPGASLPGQNFITPPFRQDAYRNVHIHYRIDPHSLTLAQDSPGAYHDRLQFVAVVYRDDGTPANSIASTEQVQISGDGSEGQLTSAVTFDQTIAIPVAGNPLPGSFFLRVGVQEIATGHIGAVEVPTEWIKLPPPQSIANASPQP